MLNLLSAPTAPNTFEKIVIFLQYSAPRPGNYGWFHLMFVALAIIATVLLCVYFRDASDKKFRRILLISWLVILLFEIYKQIAYASYHYDDETGLGSWYYTWGNFPFQLCSSAIYLLPFAAFLKEGKLRDSILSFLALFSLFGGLCVYVFPDTVFNTDMLGVQIQTMVHHGLQIVIAIYIVAHERRKFNFMFFLRSIPTFIVMLAIAMTLNLVVHAFVEDGFNMFFISPYFGNDLAILGELYKNKPYGIYLIIYIVGFVLCAFLMFAIQFAITKLCQLIYGKTRK